MSRKKKLTPEEVKERRKLRERERRKRIRADPLKHEEFLQNEKERYIKNKEKGIVKLKGNMSARQLRQKRKDWKKNTTAYRKRKQILKNNTPPPSDDEDGPLPNLVELGPRPMSPLLGEASCSKTLTPSSEVSRQKVQGRKTVKRDRSKLYKENLKLKAQNEVLKKMINSLKKREYRRKKNEEKMSSSDKKILTPNAKVQQLMEKHSPRRSGVRRKLKFGIALEHQLEESIKKVKSLKEKRVFAKLLDGKILKKYKVLTQAKRILSSKMFKSNTHHLNGANRNAKKMHIKNSVTRFYLSDYNSTQCPGKRDCITSNKKKMQKRVLTASLQDLHKRFLEESSFTVSYALFCRLRPFWVIPPSISNRDTCLCIKCNIMQLLVEALRREGVISETSVHQAMAALLCTPAQEECYTRKCKTCVGKLIIYSNVDLTKEMTYKTWITTNETRLSSKTKKEITVKITKKISVDSNVGDVISTLERRTRPFLLHLLNIRHQYKAIKQLKTKLTENQIILHVDFSENYCCKYKAEAQAVHFGASRQQITLHTGVMYALEKTEAFCSISESLRHDPEAVMTHLTPIIKKYVQENPHIDSLHLISDSPSTQYRNKKIFHLMVTYLPRIFPQLKTITWNYSESGHGKGAADGVGGTIKRTCDRMVAFGDDINNFETFSEAIKKIKNVYIETVTESDISKIKTPSNLKPFKGTMKVHMAKWDKTEKRLALHSLTPFDESSKKYFLGFFPNCEMKITAEKMKFEVGEWVQFKFDGNMYPGEITKVHEDCVTINAMVPANKNRTIWKWPEKRDEFDYNLQDIYKKIGYPLPNGLNGLRLFKFDNF